VSARIPLTIVPGPLAGKRFDFDAHTVCIVGRAADCHVRLSDDADHRRIFWHHCLLEINPPLIRVRDFGSRNGPYVNDRCIGGRRPQSASLPRDGEVDLRSGDRIRLSATVFEVSAAAFRSALKGALA
jgi:pSer/pThr/pTyr-binding forkhead associated (FHA) protein